MCFVGTDYVSMSPQELRNLGPVTLSRIARTERGLFPSNFSYSTLGTCYLNVLHLGVAVSKAEMVSVP